MRRSGKLLWVQGKVLKLKNFSRGWTLCERSPQYYSKSGLAERSVSVKLITSYHWAIWYIFVILTSTKLKHSMRLMLSNLMPEFDKDAKAAKWRPQWLHLTETCQCFYACIKKQKQNIIFLKEMVACLHAKLFKTCQQIYSGKYIHIRFVTPILNKPFPCDHIIIFRRKVY